MTDRTIKFNTLHSYHHHCNNMYNGSLFWILVFRFLYNWFYKTHLYGVCLQNHTVTHLLYFIPLLFSDFIIIVAFK